LKPNRNVQNTCATNVSRSPNKRSHNYKRNDTRD